MAIVNFALDRSARQIDADGRLHVGKSHISKATVNPYYGQEIPGYEELGLDPAKIYYLLRDPKELEQAAPTFARLPILSEHMPVNAAKPRQDLVIGAIGSDVEFKYPYLDADICIWDASAISDIESGTSRELSCCYRYVPIMESGAFDGQHYDGRMTKIVGNHLALVDTGRAGHDVLVADQNPFNEETNMEMTKLGKAMFISLSLASQKLAADSALATLVGKITRKDFDKKVMQEKLIAMDADLNAVKLGDLIDSILEMEPEAQTTPQAFGEDDPNMPTDPMESYDANSTEGKLRGMLKGKVDDAMLEEIVKMFSSMKPAEDGKDMEDKEPMMKKEEVKAAMDSLRKDLRDAEEARREVRPVVGDVFNIESAEEVYRFALDKMSVDHKEVNGLASLRSIFKVANKPSSPNVPNYVVHDIADLSEHFPQIKRFACA